MNNQNDGDAYVKGKVLVDMPGLLQRHLEQRLLLDRQAQLEHHRIMVLLQQELVDTVPPSWQSIMQIV